MITQYISDDQYIVKSTKVYYLFLMFTVFVFLTSHLKYMIQNLYLQGQQYDRLFFYFILQLNTEYFVRPPGGYIIIFTIFYTFIYLLELKFKIFTNTRTPSMVIYNSLNFFSYAFHTCIYEFYCSTWPLFQSEGHNCMNLLYIYNNL